MKKLSLVLLILCIHSTFAQDLTYIKKGGTVLIMKNNQNIKLKELKNKVAGDGLIEQQINSVRRNKTFSNIFGFTGGFLIGLPIGQAISGQNVNWELAGAGAGLVGISYIFNSSYNKKAKKFVEDYNSSKKYTTSNEPELSLNVNSNGIGFALSF